VNCITNTLICLFDLQEAEQMLAGVGEMGADALHAALTKFGVVAPDTKNPISSPFPFNLMFKTSIGPRGDLVGYLRPETAQVGFFICFPLFYYGYVETAAVWSVISDK
jgi:glycyl-tRNA synthetase